MSTEQSVLRLSIVVTLALAGLGILFGLLSGSFAIVFDGVYALIDAIMTVLALLVVRLIAESTRVGGSQSRLVAQFTMGFWHLEPMVLGLDGILQIGVAVYALINAIGSLITGGRELAFDNAIIYTAVAALAAFGMAIFDSRVNRTLKSSFVALDAKSWLMAAGLSSALLLAFIFGSLIQGTRLQWLSPYIDPAALAMVCLIVIPIPIGTVRQALADALLVTPPDLMHHVEAVAAQFVQRYHFLSYRAYVARVGRGRQIELYFIVPVGLPPKRLEEWDQIRDEIGEAIGNDTPDRWLTIAFTTDLEWAQ